MLPVVQVGGVLREGKRSAAPHAGRGGGGGRGGAVLPPRAVRGCVREGRQVFKLGRRRSGGSREKV